MAFTTHKKGQQYSQHLKKQIPPVYQNGLMNFQITSNNKRVPIGMVRSKFYSVL